MSTAAVVAPAQPRKPVYRDVRPDAMRVIFSPLVAVIVDTYRTIPFGLLSNVPPAEFWASVRDIPKPQQMRVSPDPGDPSTWPATLATGQLPKPTLAMALTPSDLVTERILKDYSELGAVEIIALRDCSVELLNKINADVLQEQLRTHQDTMLVLQAWRQSKLTDVEARAASEIEAAANRALAFSRQHWQRRKIEIMRAANGDQAYTGHADDFDLRLCEYAGIDPTMTEADQLRADVLRQSLEPQGAITRDDVKLIAAETAREAALEVGKVIGFEIAKAIQPAVTPEPEAPKGKKQPQA